ncbi:hypothetical protein GMST_35550 [Geomonas silvestris]|uniref:Uncharacterized protein n=1 Tax=Geomonas silvestris TaxID=2740184 RepID=A0A6V8MML1_9BACT|nr:hypothetical protein [Geomonas silvestris]GFO61230.1 hypothetical protein GMST_35550 [Geomonas silvestris]
MQRVKSVGDIVDSQCTRCKALLNHTIVAMVAGQVVRVKCNTCGSEHNHRPAKEAKEPKPAATRTAAARTSSTGAAPRARAGRAPAQSDESIWEEMIRPLDPDHAVPYNMAGRFKTNSLMAHPSFGTGVVVSCQSGKVEVVFKTGRKLLRCGC